MAALKIPITSEDHAQGPASADVTLVEYGDYECPYCGQAYPIVQEVQKQFGKRLRLVFRNFPLSEMHPHAEAAAEVAEFAGARKASSGRCTISYTKIKPAWAKHFISISPTSSNYRALHCVRR